MNVITDMNRNVTTNIMKSTKGIVDFTDVLGDTGKSTLPVGTYLGDSVLNTTQCVEIPETSLVPCHNADTLVSRTSRLLLDDVVYVGVIPLLTIVGVTVNVLNIAVFVKQGLGDRVRFSLFSLSIADLLALTSMYLRHMDKTLAHAISPSWASSVWVSTLVRYRLVAIHAGFQKVSNLISIVIAVDRCVCVTWPLRAARVLSTRVTGLVILVFSVLVLGGMQFVAFKYDVTCAVISGKKTPPFWLVVPSELYKDIPTVMDILDSFVFSSLTPAVSLLVTAAATIITAVQLRNAATWRDTSTAGGGSADVAKQKERTLTKMLVIISCIYIACVSPRIARSLSRFFIPEFRIWGKLCNMMMMTEALTNVTMTLNSAVNFFVYYAMGTRFRQTLRQILPCAAKELTGRHSSKIQRS